MAFKQASDYNLCGENIAGFCWNDKSMTLNIEVTVIDFCIVNPAELFSISLKGCILDLQYYWLVTILDGFR